MNVAELIKKLQEMDQTLPVLLYNPQTDGAYRIHTVTSTVDECGPCVIISDGN